ncbi:MAG TPA: 5-oxoprolinase/urea amidolyase family protein [Humibacter sp.]|nr:5-oxoprolinase/urea amidolyase family protein [Humibacter sp.]
MTPLIRPYGDRALLIELDGLPDVLALHAALTATRPEGVVDIVPAARTATVVIDPRRLPPETAGTWIARTRPRGMDEQDAEVVEIDVDYSGEDLEEVAHLSGMTVEEVVEVHTSSTWRVAFGGFAPGFGYLVTDHDRLHVPRRTTPRTSVPAGSVALAGEFGGVYPRSGPGGWQIIGRTDAVLWDDSRDPPALLRPGVKVRFRRRAAAWPAGDHGTPASRRDGSDLASCALPTAATGDSGSRDGTDEPAAALTMVEPGMQALIEDLGRPGNASNGAARSGALDRAALRLGNRLLGNDESAAAIEVLHGGARVRFERGAWFAVTGARGHLELLAAAGHPGFGSRLVEPDMPTHAEAGQTLCIGRADAGMRYVLTVRGGIRAQPVLGSRSRDVGAGIGPEPLVAGDVLTIGAEPTAGIPPVDVLTVPAPPAGTVIVHVRPGPRADWFTAEAVARFYETEWRVSPESNRIGVRLTPGGGTPSAAGPTAVDGTSDRTVLERAITDELPSEAMVPGAVQVPPAGLPVVLLADHPVTGGYPVIAVVTDADLDTFAQLRPGQGVRFRHVRPHDSAVAAAHLEDAARGRR